MRSHRQMRVEQTTPHEKDFRMRWSMVVLQLMEMINLIGLGRKSWLGQNCIPSSIPQNQFDLCAKIYTISYVHGTRYTVRCGMLCGIMCVRSFDPNDLTMKRDSGERKKSCVHRVYKQFGLNFSLANFCFIYTKHMNACANIASSCAYVQQFWVCNLNLQHSPLVLLLSGPFGCMAWSVSLLLLLLILLLLILDGIFLLPFRMSLKRPVMMEQRLQINAHSQTP